MTDKLAELIQRMKEKHRRIASDAGFLPRDHAWCYRCGHSVSWPCDAIRAIGVVEELDKRAETAEDMLRSLASWLGVGGFNADMVDPKVFEEKIRWGIDHHIRAQTAIHSPRVSDDEEKALLRRTIRDLEARADERLSR